MRESEKWAFIFSSVHSSSYERFFSHSHAALSSIWQKFPSIYILGSRLFKCFVRQRAIQNTVCSRNYFKAQKMMKKMCRLGIICNPIHLCTTIWINGCSLGLGIVSITVKPYILQKILFERICWKYFFRNNMGLKKISPQPQKKKLGRFLI